MKNVVSTALHSLIFLWQNKRKKIILYTYYGHIKLMHVECEQSVIEVKMSYACTNVERRKALYALRRAVM